MTSTLEHARTRTSTHRWVATVHTDPADIAADWRRLESEGHSTAFQRSEWLLPWYAAAAASGRARPVIVSVRRERSPLPCLILPLCRRPVGDLTRIEAADLDLSDYVAPVMAASEVLDDGDAVLATKFAIDALPACDVVRFDKIVPTVGGRANPLMSLPGAGPSTLSAYGLELRAPFAEHARAMMDGGVFRDLQRVNRKLAAERGPVRLIVADDPAEATRLFDHMLAIRGDRFGPSDVLSEGGWQGFYRQVFTDAQRAPFARVIALAAGEDIVAVDLAIEHNQALVILAGAFRSDDAWRKYGLGKLLTFLEMEWATTRGLAVFDLSIGAESYKFSFGVTELPLREWMSARSWRGQMSVAAFRAKAALRERPDLLKRVKSWLGR